MALFILGSLKAAILESYHSTTVPVLSISVLDEYVTVYAEIGHLSKRVFGVSNGFHKYNAFCTFRPNLKRIASIVAEIWLFL